MRFNEALVFLSFASIYQVADCEHLELATINIVEDLPLDSNGRLADNWLLVLDTPDCKEIFTKEWLRANPSFRNIAAYSKNLSKTFKGSGSTCNAVALSVGTKSDLILHPLEKNKIELSGTGDEDIVKWIHGKNDLSALSTLSTIVPARAILTFFILPHLIYLDNRAAGSRSWVGFIYRNTTNSILDRIRW